jgi:hypothetical protein
MIYWFSILYLVLEVDVVPVAAGVVVPGAPVAPVAEVAGLAIPQLVVRSVLISLDEKYRA